tara:strand:+ start:87 stop:926 length:840 start_codon:yes stop_codon:yes gene_type:complete
MSKMLIKNSKKTHYNYICEICCFYSNNKNDFRRHLQTKKHNANNANDNANKKTYFCNCGKSYKHLSSFSRHRNKCEIYKKSNDIVINENIQIDSIIEKHSDKNIVINMNSYYDNSITNSNNNNTNNTNNNNTFSVKNYLNNDCKDAFTVKQVLDNFQCDIMKLPSQPIPFYKDIVDKAFHNIPVEKLPIRCSDVKRNKFYGHTDEWEKDFDIVKEFIRKLVDAICEFRKIFVKKNPEWIENDITIELLGSIITNIAIVYDEQTVSKIIKYISERTKINK